MRIVAVFCDTVPTLAVAQKLSNAGPVLFGKLIQNEIPDRHR